MRGVDAAVPPDLVEGLVVALVRHHQGNLVPVAILKLDMYIVELLLLDFSDLQCLHHA